MLDTLQTMLKATLENNGLDFKVSNLVDMLFKEKGGSRNGDFTEQKKVMEKMVGKVVETAKQNQNLI